jgi:hypothetical protein
VLPTSFEYSNCHIGKQFIPLGDFIGVAFGTARITMAACLTILIFLDVLN